MGRFSRWLCTEISTGYVVLVHLFGNAGDDTKGEGRTITYRGLPCKLLYWIDIKTFAGNGDDTKRIRDGCNLQRPV
jgi:hypothetical protein